VPSCRDRKYSGIRQSESSNTQAHLSHAATEPTYTIVPSKETTMKTPIRTLGAIGVTTVLTAELIIGVTATGSSLANGTTMADQPPWHDAQRGAMES
jgi:hypothetical protein